MSIGALPTFIFFLLSSLTNLNLCYLVFSHKTFVSYKLTSFCQVVGKNYRSFSTSFYTFFEYVSNIYSSHFDISCTGKWVPRLQQVKYTKYLTCKNLCCGLRTSPATILLYSFRLIYVLVLTYKSHLQDIAK